MFMFWVIKTCFQNYFIQVENKLLKHYLEIFKEQLFFIFVKNIETKTPPNAEVDKFIYVIIMMVFISMGSNKYDVIITVIITLMSE